MKKFDIYYRNGKKIRMESELQLIDFVVKIFEGRGVNISLEDIIQVSEVLLYFKK